MTTPNSEALIAALDERLDAQEALVESRALINDALGDPCDERLHSHPDYAVHSDAIRRVVMADYHASAARRLLESRDPDALAMWLDMNDERIELASGQHSIVDSRE